MYYFNFFPKHSFLLFLYFSAFSSLEKRPRNLSPFIYFIDRIETSNTQTEIETRHQEIDVKYSKDTETNNTNPPQGKQGRGKHQIERE